MWILEEHDVPELCVPIDSFHADVVYDNVSTSYPYIPIASFPVIVPDAFDFIPDESFNEYEQVPLWIDNFE